MLQICNIIGACDDHYHRHEIIEIYNNISDMFKLSIININLEAV